jgi:hypothetical protein
MLSRRFCFMAAAVVAAAPMLAWVERPAWAGGETVQVYRSPSCGCCGMWADHLRANGYEVVVQDVDDLSGFKQMAGVPDHLQACHTATVEGYLIEGHVPAVAIDRLLEQRPDVRGLAVPGMPAGSPGMPSANPDRYHVLTFGDGSDEVFATFVGPDEE